MDAFPPGFLDLSTPPKCTMLGIAREWHRIAHHGLGRPTSDREMRKGSRKWGERLV